MKNSKEASGSAVVGCTDSIQTSEPILLTLLPLPHGIVGAVKKKLLEVFGCWFEAAV